LSIIYLTMEKQVKHQYLVVFAMSLITFATWNVVATLWVKNATWAGFFIAAGFNTVAMSVIMLLSFFVVKRKGFALGMAFWVALWLSFEKLHLDWELSWPWLTLGNGFAGQTWMIQWYEYTGVLGGSFWVLVSNALAFFLWKKYYLKAEKEKMYPMAGMLVAWIALPVALSYLISANLPKTQMSIEAVAIQPNIDPYNEKFNSSDAQSWEKLSTMADSVMLPQTRLVVAPETVLPEYKNIDHMERYPVWDSIRSFSERHNNATVILGTSFVRYFENKETASYTANASRGGAYWYDVFNAAVQITPDAYAEYFKSKLVPGVEIFPYRSFFEPLLGDAMMDFGGIVGSNVTQAERTVFSSLGDTLRVAPIICYESIYGEFVSEYVKNGANVLCIITNDGWWGNTEGHRQHLSFARLRAVETRRPIIRSANTGISAFISPDGKITKAQYYDSQKALVGQLELSSVGQTFYVRHGDFMALPMPYLALLLFLFSLIRCGKKNKVVS
ncbi:MAG: apolipoprotein N-acyltransferase, partial [Flavobacteriales bacterium]|nr:apolipoprotein N-acyltransferase [Flavobacteriales bacterium]